MKANLIEDTDSGDLILIFPEDIVEDLMLEEGDPVYISLLNDGSVLLKFNS